MKQLFSILFFSFVISNIYAQDTIYLHDIDDVNPVVKEKAIYYKVVNRRVAPVEVIFYFKNGVKVLREHFSSMNPPIQDGEYESYFYNGKTDTKGIFKNGLMEGIWLVYNKENNFIEEKANFVASLREDSTFIFNKNGKPLKADIYKHNEVVATICYDDSGKVMNCYGDGPVNITDTTGVLDRAEVMPQFPGGSQALLKFLANNIRYTSQAREKGFEGKVIIKFIIDTTGAVANAFILKDGVGGGCGKEALRVINSMPKWIPGTQKGRPVKVYYTLPISFKLSM